MGIDECIYASVDLLEKGFADASLFNFLGRNNHNTKELERSIREIVRKHSERFEDDTPLKDTYAFGTAGDPPAVPSLSRVEGCRV